MSNRAPNYKSACRILNLYFMIRKAIPEKKIKKKLKISSSTFSRYMEVIDNFKKTQKKK